MAKLYAAGAVIGLSPNEVKQHSLWELSAAINGHIEAHSGKGGARLTDQEADDLFEWMEGENDNSPVPSPKYEGEFGPRGFWLDGMQLKVITPNG